MTNGMAFSIAIAVLLAGCTDHASSPTQSPMGEAHATNLFLLNLTRDYPPPDWTIHFQSAIQAHVLLGDIRGHTDVHPVEVFQPVRMDFDHKNMDIAQIGTRPASAQDSYAVTHDDKDYIAVNLATGAGGSQQLTGWTGWAIHDQNGWHGEEAPLRWQFRAIRGLSFSFGHPTVLTTSPQGAELWVLDGTSWTSTPFIDLNPQTAFPAMDGDNNTLIVAGNDAAGRQAVWQFASISLTPTKTILGGPETPPGGAINYRVVASHGRDLVAWDVLRSSGESRGYVVENLAGVWKPLGKDFEDVQGISQAVNGTATFALTLGANDGEYSLHVLEANAWRPCLVKVPPGAMLVSDAREVFLAYERLKGVGMVRLEAAAPSCFAVNIT